jgi:hypothetical protein
VTKSGWPGPRGDITDPSVIDAIAGNAAFNAVPVRVEAA